MELYTDAVEGNGYFDSRYTCDLDNSSPELRWKEIPDGAVCFAMLAEDPDAPKGVFTHWVIFNIPVSVHHLPAGIPAQESLPNGIRQGLNSAGKLGYAGPCPPLGDKPHRYTFRLFALRAFPEIPHRASREQLLEAINSVIITTAEVTGRYQRAMLKAG